jgi:hypothetical protein
MIKQGLTLREAPSLAKHFLLVTIFYLKLKALTYRMTKQQGAFSSKDAKLLGLNISDFSASS